MSVTNWLRRWRREPDPEPGCATACGRADGGLQGAGKTTSVGKLGKFLREKHKKKVLVVSADVYRPAAIKQLETLAEQGALISPF
ncbi:signal recognition particle protein [Escherichia coli]|uniref:Signal recognition particle protein n=1 Tax=Escherichia coli TaxID=562 RepID=A0A376PQ51_ECOLX|nr:signal recognition particle protein [Escherichia coli]